MKLPHAHLALVSRWQNRDTVGENTRSTECMDCGRRARSTALGDGVSETGVSKSMIKEHERVVLTTPVPAEALEAGDVGTIIHVYEDGRAYEVEFLTLDGMTAAVVTLEASQIRPVAKREITHARVLTTT